jgi:cellulose synthase/poly-beta-1,6-N-acetylglucosamine synthase-like glycosyltransferase
VSVGLDIAGGARDAIEQVLEWSRYPVLIYFVAINTAMLLLILLAAWEFAHHVRRIGVDGREEIVGSRLAPSVSVIVPMHNEEAGIVASVRSLLALRYPAFEVVVVDDGSTDGGFEALRNEFDLVDVPRELPSDVPTNVAADSVSVPRDVRLPLVVIRKPNSGRSDAVNHGINAATGDLVVFVDADSVLEPDSLLSATKPFTDHPTTVVATGGVVLAANGCRIVAGRIVEVGMPRRWLPRIQVIEYLRAFYLGRTGWSRLRALLLISGAFGVFRRDVLVRVGGLDTTTIGEDFELVMRIHDTMRRGHEDYRVQFVAEPVCWTEVPERLGVLRKQRARWHRGLWETLWKYRRMVLNPRYGRLGTIAVPFYWAFELLAPLLELIGVVIVVAGLALGVVDATFAIWFMVLAYGYAVFVALASILIEELSFHRYPRWRDLGVVAAAAVVENLGYRQLTAWWRLEGWWASLTRREQVWGTMTRVGLARSTDAASASDAARP